MSEAGYQQLPRERQSIEVIRDGAHFDSAPRQSIFARELAEESAIHYAPAAGVYERVGIHVKCADHAGIVFEDGVARISRSIGFLGEE